MKRRLLNVQQPQLVDFADKLNETTLEKLSRFYVYESDEIYRKKC
jgi:hypothetical protein